MVTSCNDASLFFFFTIYATHFNDLLYKITRLFLVAGVKFLQWSELDEGFSCTSHPQG